MYYNNKIGRVNSQIHRIPTEKGESIEEMLRRCTENNEPVDARAPIIYTEEKDGVLPQYDIRADRFDLALDAVDKYNKSQIARAEAEAKKPEAEQAKQPKQETETKND